jgi:hypothetical protein
VLGSRPRAPLLLAGALLLLCGFPVTALASQTVALHTTFVPNKLGESTTISFDFRVSRVEGGLPSPLTSLELRLPAHMGILASTLGLASCDPATLLREGIGGCSPNARVGLGSAVVDVPLGPEVVPETAKITALFGPPNGEHLQILFYAEGRTPVTAQLVFPGQVLLASGPFSGSINATIPLIPTVPEGPNVSVIRFQSTVGPHGLTYYTHVHGRRVGYHPKGLEVPTSCPHGGFPFAASFTFQDGSDATAASTVPCPSRRIGARRHRPRSR